MTNMQTLKHLQLESSRLRSENQALKDHIERLQRAMKALLDLQHSIENITSQTNVFHLIHKILGSALDAVNSENGALLLLDESTGELVFVEVIGTAREKLLNYRLPAGKGIAGWVVENRQSKLVEDTSFDSQFYGEVDIYTGLKSRSLISVPLMDGERCLGAIEAVNTRSGSSFTYSDQEVLELVGKLASLAIIEAEKV